MSRLKDECETCDKDPAPVSLFFPISRRLRGRERIHRDGRSTPKMMDRMANKDLPPGTFPDP